jgi:hypothetical protein
MNTTTTGAEVREPRVVTAASSASLRFTARSSAIVIAGTLLAYIAVPPPHYHLAAEHDDPITLGTEVGLVLAVLFVGWRLVACRLLHPS